MRNTRILFTCLSISELPALLIRSTHASLSHTKEHMLVGLKTNIDESGNLKWPSWLNRGLDVDVIVSEVRETSRKPDEVYGVIERMCPGGRKLGNLPSYLSQFGILLTRARLVCCSFRGYRDLREKA